MEQEHRRPGNDCPGDVNGGEQREKIVDAAEVQRDAEPDREQLYRCQPGSETGDEHGRADQRIPFRSKSPEADAEIGEDTIQALRKDEGDDDNVTEQASWCIPAPIQACHPNVSVW